MRGETNRDLWNDQNTTSVDANHPEPWESLI
jgi:hypothetical protein